MISHDSIMFNDVKWEEFFFWKKWKKLPILTHIQFLTKFVSEITPSSSLELCNVWISSIYVPIYTIIALENALSFGHPTNYQQGYTRYSRNIFRYNMYIIYLNGVMFTISKEWIFWIVSLINCINSFTIVNRLITILLEP